MGFAILRILENLNFEFVSSFGFSASNLCEGKKEARENLPSLYSFLEFDNLLEQSGYLAGIDVDIHPSESRVGAGSGHQADGAGAGA